VSDFFCMTERVARKPHACYLCGLNIVAGQRHNDNRSKHDWRIRATREHLACSWIITAVADLREDDCEDVHDIHEVIETLYANGIDVRDGLCKMGLLDLNAERLLREAER
jgi:hypothetical protein